MTTQQRVQKAMMFCIPERNRNIKQLIREQKMREMKKEIEAARNTRRISEMED